MWSGPGVKDKEHLAIASLNSCFEKEGQLMVLLCGILLRRFVLTG